jgi:hypothetical protein
VVIAHDQSFTNIEEIGLTYEPAYAMRDTLPDETTAYYWVVVPSPNADGSGVHTDWSDNAPQQFNKRATPAGVLSPGAAADVTGQPRFAWTAAEGAFKYRLQVSTDAGFGTVIDDVTTAATSYTAAKTYPVDTVLYWHLRTIDGDGVALPWTPTQTFHRHLPVPALLSTNPTAGEAIPALGWAPVQGAVSYDVHLEQADGTHKDWNFHTSTFTPNEWYGTGVWRWQVRANFPESASSAYSPMAPFTRLMTAPTGLAAQSAAGRLLLTWQPAAAAKAYQVEIARNSAFVDPIATASPSVAAWAPDLSQADLRSGGTFYWRVAPKDEGGNVGAFASGVVTIGRRLVVSGVSGTLVKGQPGTVTVTVQDGGQRGVRGVKVKLAGLGVRRARKTDANGNAVFSNLKVRKRGHLVVTATRSGYAGGHARLRVR